MVCLICSRIRVGIRLSPLWTPCHHSYSLQAQDYVLVLEGLIPCCRNAFPLRILCRRKWIHHRNLVLKCDLLFLFQNKGHFSQLAGRSYWTQDTTLIPKVILGQEMQPWVSAKNEKVWGMDQIELSTFVCSCSWRMACSYSIAHGKAVCCAWKHQADMKVKDPESRGGDKWVGASLQFNGRLLF